jgi:hypothetical protein
MGRKRPFDAERSIALALSLCPDNKCVFCKYVCEGAVACVTLHSPHPLPCPIVCDVQAV